MGQHTSTIATQPVTVVDVDPATLLVDTNVRRDLRLDREFVASIEEHGVLVPIVAIRCDDAPSTRSAHRSKRPASPSSTSPATRTLPPGWPTQQRRRAAHRLDPRGLPGHAAYLTTEYGWSGGEDDADDDLAHGDYDEEEPTGALTDRERIRRPVAVNVCADPAGNGQGPRYTHSAGGTPTQTGPLSEEQKAGRRRVLDTNKAWRSAETVRRDWLRTFLARKTPPKGAATYVAQTIGLGDHTVRRAMDSGHPLARRPARLRQQRGRLERRFGADRRADRASQRASRPGHHARADPHRPGGRHRCAHLAPPQPGHRPLPGLPRRQQLQPQRRRNARRRGDSAPGSDAA